MYVDKLMGIIGGRRTESTADKIMVRSVSGQAGTKEAFEIVNALHDAGFSAQIASSDVGITEAGTKWVVETSDTGWHFGLRDVDSGDLYEVATVDEAVDRLRERNQGAPGQIQE